MILAFAGYIIMYPLYGKYIGNKIFALSGIARTPSVEFEDSKDYVPTKKEIIFGHHFTSIATTGPIVGPAIAIIWGWVPALIWVFVGSALLLAFATGASGKGALKLWPLFGAVNQTLAALALIIITLYLKARGGLKWMIAGRIHVGDDHLGAGFESALLRQGAQYAASDHQLLHSGNCRLDCR